MIVGMRIIAKDLSITIIIVCMLNATYFIN